MIQHELLEAGISQVTSVEASKVYMEVANKEAIRRGEVERVKQYYGDFVVLAKDIPSADIVTLDRVICCYDDMRGLVGHSSARARKYFAVVYLRDSWWMKVFGRWSRPRHVVQEVIYQPQQPHDSD